MGTKNSLTNLILLGLEKSVDGYVRLEDLGHRSFRYTYGYPNVNKSALSKALRRLREGGLVELTNDDKLALRLTEKGRDKALLAKFKAPDDKWDGKWRLILFDVPEKRRSARDLLRSKLKQWSFIKFQQSVWATKKNCTNELRKFIKSVGIEDWVMVVESNNIGR